MWSRHLFENEFWDDIDGVVFYDENTDDVTVTFGNTNDFSLTIPCPVLCRLEIHAVMRYSWDSTSFKTVTAELAMDGTNITGNAPFQHSVPSHTSGVHRVTGTMVAIADATPGIRTIRMRTTNTTGAASITIENRQIMVRRGRKPPT